MEDYLLQNRIVSGVPPHVTARMSSSSDSSESESDLDESINTSGILEQSLLEELNDIIALPAKCSPSTMTIGKLYKLMVASVQTLAKASIVQNTKLIKHKSSCKKQLK